MKARDLEVVECPGCGGVRLKCGWTQDEVPVLNTTLFQDAQDARQVDRGDIQLHQCLSCGLIFNAAFSPWDVSYGPQYEETQHYSAGYCRFEEELVNDIVTTCNMRNGRVVDIGCGKGAFLRRLCRAGSNRGLGIDPSVRPERLSKEELCKIRFERRFYVPGEPLREADLVCLKMTLEHLAEPYHFLRGLCVSVAENAVPLFVQVPNAVEVLETGACWDVYYEHCNYFTTSSLRNLMQRAGFSIERIWTVFNNQYICLIAHPVGVDLNGGAPRLTSEANLFSDYKRIAETRLERWRETLDQCLAEDITVLLWGGGSKAVAFLSALGEHPALKGAIDINPYKQGTYLSGSGLPIWGPDILRGRRDVLVVVMNPNYMEEVVEQLQMLSCAGRIQSLGAGNPCVMQAL